MSSIREARSLWRSARQWHEAGQSVAWLTLVGVKGSAYRRPGAKMVMASHGRMQGTLSGGCLEGDLFVHAEQAMAEGRPGMYHYDLTEDEMWGLGIGCKGQVDVWIEPIDFLNPFWQEFGRALDDDQPLVWGGQLPEGARYFTRDSVWRATGAESPSLDGLQLLAGFALTGNQDGWWWDVMRPPERLILAGAGHDAEPVARLANRAGFDVVVLDPREHVNNPEHFPDAQHWVQGADTVDPAAVSGGFWVIMNHHQRRDEDALTLAAAASPRFVGVLGPKTRTQDMIHKTGVKADGIPLHSPVGLDIGAESPEEVAVSIVAELMAARSGGAGGALHGRDRIHR